MQRTIVDAAGQALPIRHALQEGLDKAEADTLGELEDVRGALREAVEAATSANRFLADQVCGATGDFGGRYAAVHDELLALIARQAPVAGDLRLAMALIHVNDRADRVAAQCGNIATLSAALPNGARPSQQQANCLSGMARLADEQLEDAIRVFRRRDLEGARRLRERDVAINERNRRCFALAIQEGVDRERREVGFFVALMARALERVGDNAVDIAQQAVFVETGRLHPPSGQPAVS
jgi:phosphate transport system protein